ncbi:MAG TPA: PepSY domain-containing protein [Firmicutes bacterium]|nr:PepSY domain-containing protein [Bacillota bacterium]
MKKRIIAISLIAAASVFGVSLFAVNNRYSYNYTYTLSDAKDIVFGSLGIDEADAYKKQFKLDDGKYELEFVYNGVEYEYEVSAYTGEIVKVENDYDRVVYNHGQNGKTTMISLDTAKKTVFDSLGIAESDTVLTKCEFDDGKYEIEFYYNNTEYDYEVGAYSGSIVKSEKKQNNVATAITLDEAKQIVFDKIGVTESQVVLTKCELDDGKYEIEFYYNNTEYDYEVGAYTGSIVKSEKKQNNVATAITLDKAKRIVFDKIGVAESQVVLTKCELDDGKYDIEFTYNNTKYDYEVGAYSGQIVKAESKQLYTAPTTTTTTTTKPTTTTTTSFITLDEAKQIVFDSLGITESQTYDRDYEYDDGKYEISFKYNNFEYDYEVSVFGKIIDFDKEYDD